MEYDEYKSKIDEAINKLENEKNADENCTFQVKGQDVRMYAIQGSVTGLKAAAQVGSFDVGVAEFCLTGIAYGLGVLGFDPCGLDNSNVLQRMFLMGTELDAWVLENITKMIDNKDYVGLNKAGLMDVTTRVLENDN